MTATNVRLRPAEPTPGDGMVVAGYLEQAADGLFRTLLGSPWEQILAEVVVEPDHTLSYENVLVAEVDGQPVGALSAYSGAAYAEKPDDALWRAAGWRRIRLAVAALLAFRFMRFIGRVEPEAYYVQAVAVDPVRQGLGIGSLLLDAARERAIDAGAAHLALDVAESNVDARRLYERIGFVETARSARVLFEPGSRVVRMVCPLG